MKAFADSLEMIIPSELNSFKKFDGSRDPYYFQKWDDQKLRLKYWFWIKGKTEKKSKFVFIDELFRLIKEGVSKGFVERSDFRHCCPETEKSGPCGFAVMIAILLHLKSVSRAKPTRKRASRFEVERHTAQKLLVASS